ncbi:hypothetical protein KCP75_25690 [Salmonella enterica subsp. enterica]|nr:hypothetical protein KCP75_25690 [Salmonella enterica subsp. enterica]
MAVTAGHVTCGHAECGRAAGSRKRKTVNMTLTIVVNTPRHPYCDWR